MRLPLLSALLCAAALLPAAAQQIQTNRPNPAILPLPKSEDAFHFLVFGDRTGGPEAGLDVL